MLLNCGAGGLLRISWIAKRSNQSVLKEINPEYSLERQMLKLEALNTLATLCEELTHLKKPWCWERLKAGGEGMTEWDGWMASPIQRTWVWANFRREWRTGKPGVLQSMGLQRVTLLSDWTVEVILDEKGRFGDLKKGRLWISSWAAFSVLVKTQFIRWGQWLFNSLQS